VPLRVAEASPEPGVIESPGGSVTPIAGKGPLTAGSGYSLSYSAAPNCRLDITLSTTAARIGPNERLIIRYRTQLDANTQNGATLTVQDSKGTHEVRAALGSWLQGTTTLIDGKVYPVAASGAWTSDDSE
jgi:hypothetical protein